MNDSRGKTSPHPNTGEIHPAPRELSDAVGPDGYYLPLTEISNRLSLLNSPDEVCREAVELGRDRLGFERLGIWLADENMEELRGTYGTDPSGATVDERHEQHEPSDKAAALLRNPGPTSGRWRSALSVDGRNRAFDAAGAVLWNGRRAIGIIGTDTLLTGKALRDEDQSLLELYASVIGHALTLKEAENSLRDSENRFRQIFNQGPLGSAIIEVDGRIRSVNDRFAEMLGYTREELCGLRVADISAGRNGPRAGNLHRSLLCGDLDQYVCEKEYRRKDGSRFWGRLHASAVRDGDGRALYATSVIEDITRRKVHEEALAESEARFRQVAESIDQIIYLTDVRLGRVLYVNPAYKRLWGEPAASLEAEIESFKRSVVPEDLVRVNAMLARMRAGDPVEEEFRVRLPDGSTRWMREQAYPIRGDDGSLARVVGIVEDATDRRQRDDRIRFQAQLLDGVREAVVAADMAGRIVHWGRGAERLYGRSAAEMLGRPVEDLKVSVEMPLNHGSWTSEQKVVRKDGSTLWVETRVSVLLDEGGDPTGLVSIDHDITQRKEAELAILESERRKTALLAALPDLVMVLSADGVVREVLTTDHPDLLAAPGEAVGRHLQDYFPPDIVIGYRECAERAIRTGATQRFAYDVRMNGTKRSFEAGIAQWGAHDIITVIRDITPLKEAEASRLRAAEELESVINTLGDGLIILDADNTVTRTNPRLLEILGLPETKIIGRTYRDWIHPDWVSGVEANLRRRRSGSSTTYESVVLRPDGWEVPVLITGAPRLGPDGEYLGSVGTFKDISEQKKTEHDMIRLERLSAVGQLAAGVSHNLNNILTTVLGPAQLIERMTDNPAILKEARDILKSAQRAADLVRRLNLSVRGELHDALEQVDVDAAIVDAVRAARPKWKDEAEAAGIGIRVDTDLRADHPIRGTAAGLHDILLNLLFNAVDSMPRGGEVRIRTRSIGDAVELTVTDTGIGMDEQTRLRVFEPFFTTKAEIGTGLGLATVHNTVTQWGGAISVDSSLRAGATFALRLPTWEGAETSAPPGRRPPDASGKTGSVLVVDDDPAVGPFVRALLEHTHQVRLEETAEAALQWLRGNACDVALLDLGLPDAPGHLLARQLKEVRPGIATILMTGWQIESKDHRREPFDLFLQKPFRDIAQVRAAVGEAVALARGRMRSDSQGPKEQV